MRVRPSTAFVVIAVAACGRVGFDPRNDGRGDANLPGTPGNRMFVTSSLHSPISLAGDAADAVCSDRAREADLPGTFVPWISTTMLGARARLAGARGWYRVDGAPFVDTVDQLIDDGPLMPPNVDERGARLGDDPYFATTGSFAGVASANCDDFTNAAATALAGATLYTGGSWNNATMLGCTELGRLYCFQTDHAEPLVISRASGRRAFVSVGNFTPSSGRQTADTMCATEATNAGLTGTFLALLPDAMPAATRFVANGPPWVRIDGIALAPTAAAFLAGETTAALNVTASGAFVDTYVVTGGYPPTYPADPLRTCDAWTNPNGGNAFGHATGAGAKAFTQTTTDCMTAARVYCVEL